VAFAGSGLWFVPAHHDANQSSSREEVEIVAELVRALIEGGIRWRDREAQEHPLGLDDILVIAPYNAQVADLIARLPTGARVGTVDRFQGQEAPIVIYSMTTSTPEDARAAWSSCTAPTASTSPRRAPNVRASWWAGPRLFRARLPEPEADEAGERVLPVPGDRPGGTNRSAGRQRVGRCPITAGQRRARLRLGRVAVAGARAYALSMARFLVKTEPSTYAFADLKRDKRTVWDGVSNPVALKHLATIRKGDTVVVYHTGDEKQAVGLAGAVSDAYPDPKLKDPKRWSWTSRTISRCRSR